MIPQLLRAPGTALEIHDGSGIKPILESSLDAMVVSMLAPQLDHSTCGCSPSPRTPTTATCSGS